MRRQPVNRPTTTPRYVEEPSSVSLARDTLGAQNCAVETCVAGEDLKCSFCDVDYSYYGSLGDKPAPRYVTAALRVDYLQPTPLGDELELRGHVTEKTERKAVVSLTVSVRGTITVRAEAVAVRIPKSMEQSPKT